MDAINEDMRAVGLTGTPKTDPSGEDRATQRIPFWEDVEKQKEFCARLLPQVSSLAFDVI